MTAPPVLLAALLGLSAGAAAWLALDGATRRPRRATAAVPLLVRLRTGNLPLRAGGALTAGAVAGMWTGWPVAAALAAVAAWALPPMLAGADTARRDVATLEAVATWTESLRGTLQAAAGLEHALIATAATAPEPIQAPVRGLATALRSGVRLPEALDAFAADLAHPDADRVVASLRLAAVGRARNLAEQLGVLATATREQVAARRRIHAERATTRTSVRMIVAATLVMVIGQLALNRSFLDPYATASGQLVLAAAGGLFAAGFAWLHRMSRLRPQPRVLGGTRTGETR
jgi:Flp pilus assembly protein TadB